MNERRWGIVLKYMEGPVSFYRMPWVDEPVRHRTAQEQERISQMVLASEKYDRRNREATTRDRSLTSPAP